jgi:hypothetical protein
VEGKRGVTVKKVTRPRKLAFVTITVLAVALALNAPSEARGFDGHGSSGRPGGGVVNHGFEHHDFDGHHFDRGVHDRFRFGVAVGPVLPYYSYDPYYPPAYGYETPAYWYYCPSYGAYYPNVASCPGSWVPVPAS